MTNLIVVIVVVGILLTSLLTSSPSPRSSKKTQNVGLLDLLLWGVIIYACYLGYMWAVAGR